LLERIRPDFMLNSLSEIPLDFLKRRGITAIIIDLDNTLTNWNCTHITEDVDEWLQMLEKQGFKLCIVSNNGQQRIQHTLKKYKLPYIPNALKPRKKAFLQAMELLNTFPHNTAVIGDQLFTDILGGKRLGLTTILVTPRSKNEFIGTKIMRKLERVILSRFYEKKQN